MRAEELRIGNLVYHDNELHETNGATIVYQNSICKCEPIPLTEEWLVKFGFKGLGKDTFYLKSVKIHHRKRGFVLAKRYKDINHVNQLQNLYFALTGEELEIKN